MNISTKYKLTYIDPVFLTENMNVSTLDLLKYKNKIKELDGVEIVFNVFDNEAFTGRAIMRDKNNNIIIIPWRAILTMIPMENNNYLNQISSNINQSGIRSQIQLLNNQ